MVIALKCCLSCYLCSFQSESVIVFQKCKLTCTKIYMYFSKFIGLERVTKNKLQNIFCLQRISKTKACSWNKNTSEYQWLAHSPLLDKVITMLSRPTCRLLIFYVIIGGNQGSQNEKDTKRVKTFYQINFLCIWY